MTLDADDDEIALERWQAALEQRKRDLESADTRLADLEIALKGSARTAEFGILATQRTVMAHARELVARALASESLAECRRRVSSRRARRAIAAALPRATLWVGVTLVEMGRVTDGLGTNLSGPVRRVREAIEALGRELEGEHARFVEEARPDLLGVIAEVASSIDESAQFRREPSVEGASLEIVEAVRQARRALEVLDALPVTFDAARKRELDAIAALDADLAAAEAIEPGRVEELLRAELADWRQALESARRIDLVVERLEALEAREREPHERGGLRVRGDIVRIVVDARGMDRLRQVRALEARVLAWAQLARRHTANPPRRLVLE